MHAVRVRYGLAESGVSSLGSCSLANALWLDDRLAESLTWARWATLAPQGAPVHPMAWRALGNALLDLGEFAEADRVYRCADPWEADPAICSNRSQAALGRADFAEAWRLAESRLRRTNPPAGVLPGPWWRGWPEVDDVTVWSEQGLGDTLQFLRWLPGLLGQGVSVRLLVDAPLERLLAAGLQWMGPALRVDARRDEDLHFPGCHGSLLSLPWLLQEAKPPAVPPGGYVRLSRQALQLTGRARRRPRVGVLWGAGRYLDGRAQERNYRRKSVLGPPLGSLLEALEKRPVALVKLQFGPDRDLQEQGDVAWAGSMPPNADFLALAEMLQQLDLVLCVDTAAAHLAGAMDRPVWVLLPWAAASRWQRSTATTLWYGSWRLWRQPRHGDWEALWPELLTGLDRWISDWKRAS
jgi:hypothetical protein